MENLPVILRPIIDQSTVIPIAVGHSRDMVYRLETDETYFLKIGASLKDEHDRLQWLAGRLPVPEIVYFEVNHGKHYLLTKAIHGQMLQRADLPIQRVLELYAEAARLWHNVPIGNCPFQWGIPQQIDTARHHLKNDLVDADDFAPCFYGKSAPEMFADLLNAMPDTMEESVITHGDLSLPNVLVDAATQTITGFVDVGAMGISDRHLDLVIAAQSIRYNFGGKYIPYFYEQYGVVEDPIKRRFYSILNELM